MQLDRVWVWSGRLSIWLALIKVWILAAKLVLALAEPALAALLRDATDRTPLERLDGGAINHMLVMGSLIASDGIESDARFWIRHRPLLLIIATNIFIWRRRIQINYALLGHSLIIVIKVVDVHICEDSQMVTALLTHPIGIGVSHGVNGPFSTTLGWRY